MKSWMWFVVVIMFALIGLYGGTYCNDGGHYYLLTFAWSMGGISLVGLALSEF